MLSEIEGNEVGGNAAHRTRAQPWTPEARNYVEALQERHYRKLSGLLGLGNDPKAAYRQLSRGTMTGEDLDIDKMKDKFAPYLSETELAGSESEVRAIWDRYTFDPPTPYEDPNWYRCMAMIFDDTTKIFAGKGKPISPEPMLATLASGNVNALITEETNTKVPIIFFDQGLFPFFFDIAKLAGWAFPPLSLHQLTDNRALSQIKSGYTMPFEASQFFGATLYAYVVGGAPIEKPSPLPNPSHNAFIGQMLLRGMESFIMAHELSHLTLHHLDNPYNDKRGAWQQEFDADEVAMVQITEGPGSWAFNFLCCDLALTALHFLDLSLAVLSYGHKVPWISKTHPDALSRRERLRDLAHLSRPPVFPISRNSIKGFCRWADSKIGQFWLVANSSDSGSSLIARLAARNLCAMTDAVFERLWGITQWSLLLAHTQKVRPAAVWKEMIAKSFCPEERTV